MHCYFVYLFNPSLQLCGVHLFHRDLWRTHIFQSGEEWLGDRINWVIPWYSQNLSKIGCCTSGPRYRYDFDLPGVECMIKMPFFPLPCAPCSTRKTWRVCPLPREGTAWALCRFCGVESHTYVMHLLMINNYFVSNSMSVVVLLH